MSENLLAAWSPLKKSQLIAQNKDLFIHYVRQFSYIQKTLTGTCFGVFVWLTCVSITHSWWYQSTSAPLGCPKFGSSNCNSWHSCWWPTIPTETHGWRFTSSSQQQCFPAFFSSSIMNQWDKTDTVSRYKEWLDESPRRTTPKQMLSLVCWWRSMQRQYM